MTDSDKIGVSASVRYVPDKGPSGKWTTSLQLHYKRLSAGVDYRPLTEQLGPLASLRVLDETDKLPSLVLGTGPDVFDGQRAQAYFGMISKEIADIGGLSISPFIGGAYIGEPIGEPKVLGGVNMRKGPFSLMAYHNGLDPHLIVGYDLFEYSTLSFVYWGLEMPGAAFSIKF